MAVAAVGIGGGAGLFVWWRRSRGGATSAGSADGQSGSGYIANPAYANTTGTDVANWVGNVMGHYNDQLAAYQQTLTSELEQLRQLISHQPTPAPAPAPVPTTPRYGVEPWFPGPAPDPTGRHAPRLLPSGPMVF